MACKSTVLYCNNIPLKLFPVLNMIKELNTVFVGLGATRFFVVLIIELMTGGILNLKICSGFFSV